MSRRYNTTLGTKTQECVRRILRPSSVFPGPAFPQLPFLYPMSTDYQNRHAPALRRGRRGLHTAAVSCKRRS